MSMSVLYGAKHTSLSVVLGAVVGNSARDLTRYSILVSRMQADDGSFKISIYKGLKIAIFLSFFTNFWMPAGSRLAKTIGKAALAADLITA